MYKNLILYTQMKLMIREIRLISIMELFVIYELLITKLIYR